MKKRSLLLLVVPLLLTGCLFSINQPVVGPEGTSAVFLGENGEFNLVLEQGTLHLLTDEGIIPVSLTVTSGAGAVLDWNVDSQEFLYVVHQAGELFELDSSTLYRVAADPEAEPVLVYESDGTILDAAFRADGRIALLENNEAVTGTLSLLDVSTGDMETISDAIYGFRQDANRETLYLFAIDESSRTALGVVGPWEPGNDDSEPLAVFLLSTGMLESLYLVDDDFFWDVDPTGRHVALALYDDVMVAPRVENEVPTLFFIDDGERLTEIADVGYMPVFSPDGRYLAYIGGTEDGGNGQALLYELRTWESTPVPGTQGATTCFWLADDRLGVTLEAGDTDSRVMVYNFSTGEFTLLIE